MIHPYTHVNMHKNIQFISYTKKGIRLPANNQQVD